MKSNKYFITVFAILMTLLGIMQISAQASKKNSFKSFEITISRTGGLAGQSDILTLDKQGVLSKRNKTQDANDKLSDKDLKDIRELVAKLKLPAAKLKTIKGLHIYDGIYSSFVITLDDKKYLIEGTDFDDQKYIALTAGQKEIVTQIKARLESAGTKLPQGFVK